MSDLRQDFWDTMCELAENDKDVVLITGDLGYSFDKEYVTRFPKQYLNSGCMEQTMIGIAAGMALAGKKPYVYSGAIFVLLRPFEQVRDDIAYNNMNVKLIGTGASGFLGFTHNLSLYERESEMMQGFPNIKCRYVDNKDELRGELTEIGPAYIKI